MTHLKTALLLMLAWTVAIDSAPACTVFVQDDGDRHYYGSNFDWHNGFGQVLINPRGLHKQAYSADGDPGEPLHWRSRYGSVTFVQYGRGFPKGGMNEAGLVIEGLMLLISEYQAADQRSYIGSTGQFKQYLLDTCATVAEVVEQAQRVRLTTSRRWAPGVHFMVADQDGDAAVLEYLEGRLTIHRGEGLPLKVLTNHVYIPRTESGDEAMAAQYSFAGGSRGRFDTAARRLAAHRSASGSQNVSYAMETLDRAAGFATQWQLVYDQQRTVVYWRTNQHPMLRWLDLKKIDFSCRAAIMGLSVQAPVKGEANDRLTPFTMADNRRLALLALRRNQGTVPVPQDLWERVAGWSGHETCDVSPVSSE